MFKELFALANEVPVLLLLSREGEKLRVNITRRKDADDEDALAISVLAAPEELDRDLPGVLADGLALKSDPPASIADQVKGQIAAAKNGKKSSPAKRTVKKKATPKPRARTTPKKAASPPKQAIPTKKPGAKKAKGSKGARLTPTPALAAVLDSMAPIAFNDAMAKVWAYIKAKDLKQHVDGKPHVRADELLKAALGDELVSVAELPSRVKAQLSPAGEVAKETAPISSAQPVTPQITPLLPQEKLDEIAPPVPVPVPVEEPIAQVAAAAHAEDPRDLFDDSPAMKAKAAVDADTPDLF